jgi:hypothetical protein
MRDPVMHHTTKVNQVVPMDENPLGIDKESSIDHSVVTTAANVHALSQAA